MTFSKKASTRSRGARWTPRARAAADVRALPREAPGHRAAHRRAPGRVPPAQSGERRAPGARAERAGGRDGARRCARRRWRRAASGEPPPDARRTSRSWSTGSAASGARRRPPRLRLAGGRRAARMSRMSRRTRKARPRSPSRGDDAVRRCVRQLRTVRWAEHGRYAASRLAPARRVPAGWRARQARRARGDAGPRRRERRADVRGRASRGDGGIGRNRRREKRAPRAARVALGRALGEAFVARLVPATAMFAQLYALLVEENRTTQRTADGGSATDYARPATRRRPRVFEKHVRVRVALATLAACRPRLAPDVFVPAVSKNVTKNADVKGKEKVKTRRKVSFETRRVPGVLPSGSRSSRRAGRRRSSRRSSERRSRRPGAFGGRGVRVRHLRGRGRGVRAARGGGAREAPAGGTRGVLGGTRRRRPRREPRGDVRRVGLGG